MFEKYCNEIKQLKKFNKEDILIEKFELFQKVYFNGSLQMI